MSLSHKHSFPIYDLLHILVTVTLSLCICLSVSLSLINIIITLFPFISLSIVRIPSLAILFSIKYKLQNCVEKTKMKKEEPGNGPFFVKNISFKLFQTPTNSLSFHQLIRLELRTERTDYRHLYCQKFGSNLTLTIFGFPIFPKSSCSIPIKETIYYSVKLSIDKE